MTPAKIRAAVDRAVLLDRQIREQTEELKALKASLVQEAKSRPDELGESERGGGLVLTFGGDNGCIARVSLPAPTLKASIKGTGKPIEKIQTAAGRYFHELFVQAPNWCPVPRFRERASQLMDAKAARKLVRLCESNSAPRVSFETKEQSS